jgi:hypothetical protein
MAKNAGWYACAALALLLPACQQGGNFCLFGYSTAPNYRSDIHTVRVKVFANRTYRQGLEFELTRAVIREIEEHTPYKVVRGDAPADTELTGTIMTFTKGTLAVNNENEPRDQETTLAVEFIWRDLRNGQYLSRPPRRPFEAVAEGPPPPIPPGPRPLEEVPGAPTTAVITPPFPPGAPVGSGNGILVTTQSHFIPEIGQSLGTAYQADINKLAREIRQLMETPW